jgi:diguanylate cyclase (GGDEF)-like protein
VKRKFEGFYNAFKLKSLSEKDLLTNINNRNKYEMDFVDHPDQNTHQIAAVYVDVNGLHELNNTQGHEAGDEMLKYVAKLMKNYFGASSTYRLGEDEFLCVSEENIEKVEATMKAIDRKLREKHYYISYGLAKGNASEALFKEAEEKMYINKRTFYSHKENDRRRH